MGDEIGQRGGSKSIRDSLSVARETVNRDTLELYEFGPFRLDPAERKLLRDNEIVALTPKAFDTLLLLVRNSGHLLGKDELIKMLWPDSFVEEGNLSNNIFLLRKALGEDPPYIETVPKRGYRFVGAVRQLPLAAPPHLKKPPERPTRFSASHRNAFRLVAFLTLGVIAVAAALVGINVRGWRDRLFAQHTNPPVQALAVLPLANLSGDPEQEYFADGITEALITELGKVSSPRVISRQSIMQYKGSKKGLSEIARELNVDAVLEGAVERSGDRVRVIVRLDQVSPERQLWSNQYNRDIRDLLRLQDEIARAVTDELQVKLTPEERTRLTSAHAEDPEAHDHYLHGRYLLGLTLALNVSKLTAKRNYTDLDVLAAIGQFKQAIEKDPAYALAYAGLADAHIALGNPVYGGHSPKETLSAAKAAAAKALELDPSLAEAHFSLAQTLEYDWNWPEAEKEYKLALKLNPNYADAHMEYGRFVQALGRNDEALTQMHYADELDPFNIRIKDLVAYVTYAARQYDLALKLFESLGDDRGQMWAYREKEMYPEAIAAWQRWTLRHPSQRRCPHCLATLAGIYGLEGRNDEAQALIAELRETARHRYVSGVFFAEAYIGLSHDQAITWLERAYEEHDEWMVYVNAYPGLDRLRSEPRFQALVRRMNFPK